MEAHTSVSERQPALRSPLRKRAVRVAVSICLSVSLGAAAIAEHRGVINDPDGYVNVRDDKRLDAPVIATVKSGEPFSFEFESGEEWCSVTLGSGKKGWMHQSRVRLHFTGRDLRGKTEPNNELHYITRKLGIDYYALARRAAGGDPKALKSYFGIRDTDGAAAELHFSALPEVFHLVGDDTFTAFLRSQPLEYQLGVRDSLVGGHAAMYPFEPTTYLQRHFPKTAQILFRAEIVDWSSPDGRYVIRKVFSDGAALERSKVVRAELLNKESGQMIYDLTDDDIGTGDEREGKVLWAPDSKRFAYLSCSLPIPPGNLFSTPRPPLQRKQTTVYQESGDSFVRIELSIGEMPGRKKDAEVEGAVCGHEFIEPLRWIKPNVLLLQRHEYFEKLKPTTIDGLTFESIHGFDRLYEITITIESDGRANASIRVRDDR